jgi:hypothetical protein
VFLPRAEKLLLPHVFLESFRGRIRVLKYTHKLFQDIKSNLASSVLCLHLQFSTLASLRLFLALMSFARPSLVWVRLLSSSSPSFNRLLLLISRFLPWFSATLESSRTRFVDLPSLLPLPPHLRDQSLTNCPSFSMNRSSTSSIVSRSILET